MAADQPVKPGGSESRRADTLAGAYSGSPPWCDLNRHLLLPIVPKSPARLRVYSLGFNPRQVVSSAGGTRQPPEDVTPSEGP